MSTPRIYFAGPDVFMAGRDKHISDAKKYSNLYRFECVHPGEFNFTDGSLPEEIRDRCLKAAMECEYPIANVEPWLGCDADPGTAVEIGAAFAAGKTVITYGHRPNTVSERAKGAGYTSLVRFLDKPSSNVNEMMWSKYQAKTLEQAVKIAHSLEFQKGMQ